MRRPTRRYCWPLALLAAALIATAGPSLLAGPAHASPPPPASPAAIEPLAGYVPQTTCDPTIKPGTAALRTLVLAAYPGTGDLGIVRNCDVGGTSEHKEGRAWDWAVNSANPVQDAQARDLFAWLFATDGQGEPYAMARRLGIMYLIYNRQIWGAYDASAGWVPYYGANPHTDHVHISLSWDGAHRQSSYWLTGPPIQVTQPVGTFLTKWSGLGGIAGVLGRPVSAEYAVSGGRAQNFIGGRIYAGSTTGTHAVYGAIYARYVVLGAHTQLGLPVAEEAAAGAGRVGAFERGRVFWSTGTGAHAVSNRLGSRYDALGGPAGVLGLPTAEEVAAGSGRVGVFQVGRIYWSSPTGAHGVYGAILQHYDTLGGPTGVLGLPAGDESDVAGGRVSGFQGGRIYWSGGTGAYVVHGMIGEHYDALNGPASRLGLPISDETAVPGGRQNSFQNGRIIWSGSTGAESVQGLIAARYAAEAGPFGYLGLPTTDEFGVRAGRASSFQGGRIYWSGGTGARIVHGLIGARYDALGAADSPLGLPTGDEQAAGPGRSSTFQAGDIYWSGPTGVAVVAAAVGGQYAATGGAAGYLGLPSSDLQDVAVGVQQQVFQAGRIYLLAGATHYVRGAICDAYVALSGPTGALGVPISNEYDVPGGRRSDFQNGHLTWSAGTNVIVRT